jgi:N-acetylneuraminic acid mutarotase
MSLRRFISSASLLALVAAVAVQASAQPLKTSSAPPTVTVEKVIYPTKADTSPELRSIAPRINSATGQTYEIDGPRPAPVYPGVETAADAVVQSTPGAEGVMPAPALTFEGGSSDENRAVWGSTVAPPDTNGDVGPNHYVQTVNLTFSIYNKAGARLYGPAATNTLWAGFGGACETRNDGDPIVLYDSLADRWVISQFAVGGPYYQCFAISKTGDPLGAWYRYEYFYSNTSMNDYPKLGVWPNAYTMTAREFAPSFIGSALLLIQRDRLLVGLPNAGIIKVMVTGTGVDSFLPADVDGNPPPVGAPIPFLNMADSPTDGVPADRLFAIFLTPNWSNLTVGISAAPISLPSAGPGDPDYSFVRVCSGTRNCFAQPGTSQRVDAISARSMFPLKYRNFGTHQSLVFTQTVDAGGSKGGIRWWELRQPNGLAWTTMVKANIYQASTYAPAGTLNRFMGSAAMDGEGNIAVGYSVSDSSVYPGIRYAGRLANDTLGVLAQDENTLYAGAGSQNGVNRWGDYSSMSVDPVDDCTFWYTQQYVASSTGTFNWSTRVGAFKFSTCVSPASQHGAIQGTVTAGGMPVQGALVSVGSYTTSTDSSGFYSIPNIAAGTYAASAAKYGYNTATANPVITAGATTTQDFVLTTATTVRLEGYVTDGTAHVYGLYAMVTVSGGGLFPGAVTFTDPLTGYYKIDLVAAPAGLPYFVNFTSIYPGYLPWDAPPLALVANTVLNVPLQVGVGACAAPGYQKSAVTTVISENFDAAAVGSIPAGFTATASNALYPWQVANSSTVGSAGDTPQAPYSVPNYLWFNAWDAPTGATARIFNTVPLDLTGKGVTLSFYMWHETVGSQADRLQVQVSTNGGATWQSIGPAINRNNGQVGWQSHSVYVENYAGSPASVLVALQAISAFGSPVRIDNLTLTTHVCAPVQGGMVVGNVYDANTGAALNEALVSHDLGGSTYTFPTTYDPAQDDGFYFLFSPIPGVPPAARNLTASKNGYNSASATIIVPADGVIEQNFSLTAGAFTMSPSEIRLRVNAGLSGSAPLTLQNGGTASATFSILERLAPPSGYFPGVRPYGASGFRAFQTSPVSEADFGAGVKAQPSVNATGNGPAYPGGPVYGAVAAACDDLGYYVFGGYTGTTVSGGAYKYNALSGTWESLPAMPVPLYRAAAGCVNGMIYIAGGITTGSLATNAFLTFDTYTRTWTTSTLPGIRYYAAGAAVNGKFYIVGGRDTGAIYGTVWMYDPSTGTFSNLATMPTTVGYGSAAAQGQYIYYTGGRATGSLTYQSAVHRYDTVTNTWTTGPALPLARALHASFSYGPYLYVVGGQDLNSATVQNTLRYDPSTWPAGSWASVPSATFPVNLSSPAYAATNNKLFIVTGLVTALGGPITAMHQFIDDGFTTPPTPADDLPYMTETPSSGTVPAGSSQIVVVGFDTTLSTKFGLHANQLLVNNSTPYGSQLFGTLLTKAFLDVPEGAFGDAEIHGLAGARITYGVSGNMYAPNDTVSRAQMAVFLTRSTQGYAFIPPFPGPGFNTFADVTYDYWAANYIEFIYDPMAYMAANPIPQLTTGCSASPLNYCPDLPTTRGEMSVFVTRAAFGGSQYLAASPVFSDVPEGHVYRGFIEKMWQTGVSSGCGGGMFCPDRPITRAEMAIFLVRAFNIPYLH